MNDLPDDVLMKLRDRRGAHLGGSQAQWDDAETWVARSLALTRPGGIVSMVLPDGRPFNVRRPLVTEDGTSGDPVRRPVT
jgi:hypothetical protein